MTTQPTRPRGHFIVFEGGEGVGKSTQIAKLATYVSATYPDLKVVQSREPGGTPAAEALRRIALDQDFVGLAPRAEALVFAAARGDHAYQVLRPALEQGACVILDRYVDSSIVYQGLARGLGAEEIEQLSMWATESLIPDLVIVLDLDPAVGLSRVKTPDRLESEGLDFHHAVRHGFLERAAAHPDRFVVIDAAQDIDAVAEAVAQAVDKVLNVH